MSASPKNIAGAQESSKQPVEEPAAQSLTSRFRNWRRDRPFMGGLFLILSGIIILAPAYLSFQVQDLLVVVSAMSGVSTLLIGVVLIMSGIGVWVRPDLSVFAGILALVLAVVSLPASNFGGFIIGALCGIIGGSLLIAWDSRDRAEVKEQARSKKRAKRLGSNKTGGKKPGAEKHSDQDLAVESAAESKVADEANSAAHAADESPSQHGVPAEHSPAEDNPAEDSPAGRSFTEHSVVKRKKQRKNQNTVTLEELLGNSSTTKSVLAIVLALSATTAVMTAPQPHAEAQVEPVAPSIVGITQPVTADEVKVVGNAKVAIVTVETQQGPQKMIELSGNTVTVDNIAFELPGQNGAISALTSGPGTKATLTGRPAVLRTRTLNATPAVAGVNTIPVELDAAGNIDELTDQLVAAGLHELSVPDAVMSHIALRDVSLDALSVAGDVLDAPNLSVHAR